MVTALWISAIGMGLVFVAILLLWGLMALLVRVTAEKPAAVVEPFESQPEALAAEVDDTGHALRRRAAAAAVAVAVGLRDQSTSTTRSTASSGQPMADLSAWQAVQRAGQLGQRNGASRKVNS